MKCSNCGKEFGEGINCQYCGIDRVTGLGNYSGYHNLEGDKNYSSYDGMSSSPKTMLCFACGEIIPTNSEFCPYCSKQLYVTCPKCGNTYSSQYPACNKCGTNRDIYKKQKEAERRKVIEEQRKQEEFKKYLQNLGALAQGIQEQPSEGEAEFARKINSEDESGCMMQIVVLILILVVACVVGSIIYR